MAGSGNDLAVLCSPVAVADSPEPRTLAGVVGHAAGAIGLAGGHILQKTPETYPAAPE
jgi:hypothetical protein